ncbi:MAG: hypothetical protein LBM66_05755 [Bifidobacteriaceae bacterium]|nr:hypothetical protein [Bifidobacteriaceae bacterium]
MPKTIDRIAEDAYWAELDRQERELAREAELNRAAAEEIDEWTELGAETINGLA